MCSLVFTCVHLVFVYFVYTQILNTRCTQLCTMVGRLAVVEWFTPRVDVTSDKVEIGSVSFP